MTKMVERTFTISEAHARFIDERVSKDGYPSVSHVVQHAIDDLIDVFDDLSSPQTTEWLRREVLPVLERIDRGEEELIPAEQVFDELEAMLDAKTKAAE